jgi:hypothetical protein
LSFSPGHGCIIESTRCQTITPATGPDPVAAGRYPLLPGLLDPTLDQAALSGWSHESRELVAYPVRLLAAERRAAGTRRGARALTRLRQAPMVLAWLRKNEDKTLLGAGFGVSRATAYR